MVSLLNTFDKDASSEVNFCSFYLFMDSEDYSLNLYIYLEIAMISWEKNALRVFLRCWYLT